MKRILLIDNYDSFVWNIVQLLRQTDDCRTTVLKNDDPRTSRLSEFDGVLLSPGPGLPEEAGRLMGITASCLERNIPLLGVCLGHQAIARALGAELVRLHAPLHGHRTLLQLTDPYDPLLAELVPPIFAGRYHSWTVEPHSLPACLRISSVSEEGHVMSFRHTEKPVHGLQFHPESFMTDYGERILSNWIGTLSAETGNQT